MQQGGVFVIGQRIKALRNEANLTQQELAEGIISRTYLSLIEKNSVHPSINVLKKLSEKLNCTLEDFTLEVNGQSISLLNIKKEIKWAENQVIVSQYDKLTDFLNQNYELLETISKEERATVLWIRAKYNYHNKIYKDAKQYALRAKELAHSFKDVTLLLRSLELLGRIEFDSNNKHEAILLLDEANNLAIFENVVSTDRISVLKNLAFYYASIGEYYVAINLCNEALDYNKKLKTHFKAIELENILGRAYRALGDLSKSEHHFNRAVKYCELNEVSFDYIGSISNKAMLLNAQGKYDEAYTFIKKANELLDIYNFDHNFSKYIRLHLAEVLINKNQLKKAEEILIKYAELDTTGYGYELIGDIAFKRKEYDKALTYYHKTLDGDDLPNHFLDAIQKISQIYELQGNYDKSNEYLKKCIKVYKEITPIMI